MRLWLRCRWLLLAGCVCAQAQQSDLFTRPHAWSVFADYSNDSSHIFIGRTGSRRLTGIGAGYMFRLKRTRFAEWDYEPEIRPLYFLQDPTATGTSSVVITGGTPGPGGYDGPPVGSFSGAAESACVSGTIVNKGTTPSGLIYVQTITETCGTRWSYVGGISPLGQRVNFLTQHRLQPYFAANAGFLAATHDEPIDETESFNFTFEGGVGLEYYTHDGRSWAVDFRVHHLSNAYRGIQNPGIDNATFRVNYRFAR